MIRALVDTTSLTFVLPPRLSQLGRQILRDVTHSTRVLVFYWDNTMYYDDMGTRCLSVFEVQDHILSKAAFNWNSPTVPADKDSAASSRRSHAGSLGQGKAWQEPPSRRRLRLPALLEYASRFPPPPRHSLPTTTTTHHSLSRHRHHHHRTRHIHHAKESDTGQHRSSSCSERAAFTASTSKSRACVTTGRVYSDDIVAAHRVGGLQRDRASKHRSEHIRRRATRAHRHCYQAAQT
jgi:hypothetical protein